MDEDLHRHHKEETTKAPSATAAPVQEDDEDEREYQAALRPAPTPHAVNGGRSSPQSRTAKRRKRKPRFEVEYTQLSTRSEERLYAAGANRHVYHLAHVILREAFKLHQMAGNDIVLSREVTGISDRKERWRAIATLIKLDMIEVQRDPPTSAPRVTAVHF
jgi:hypothetical protein